MILPHLLFIAAYAVYAGTFIRAGIPPAYPVFLAPFVIYFFLFAAAFCSGKIEKARFQQKFRALSNLMYAFVLLAAAPVILKLNLPEPHNFALRKMELLLGASYAIFIFLLAGSFLYGALKTVKIEKIKAGAVFVFIFSFTFAFFFSVSLWFNYANQPTGDEPEYLMMSASMAKDGDINLANNYANRDYAVFYNKELVPQGKNENGRLYSYHPVLASVFILPFYAAAGRLGATILMNLLAALFCALIFYFLANVYGQNKMPAMASLICAFSLPVFMFTNMICSEVLSGVLILGSLIIFLYKKERFYAACLFSALIPWSHPRNAVLWLALGIIALIEYRREISKAGTFILIQALSGFLLLWFNYSHFGSLIPGAYTETVKFQGSSQSFGFNPAGMLGLFFDQEFGLFFYTPVFSVFIAGIILLFKRDKKMFWYSLLLFFPYYIMLASYAGWSGGGGASPRFFVPVIFLFVLFAAEALVNLKDKTAVISARALIAAGSFISLVIFMVPWFRWNKGLGENWILKFASSLLHLDIAGLFPALWVNNREKYGPIIFWVVCFIVLNLYILFKNRDSVNRRSKPEKP